MKKNYFGFGSVLVTQQFRQLSPLARAMCLVSEASNQGILFSEEAAQQLLAIKVILGYE